MTGPKPRHSAEEVDLKRQNGRQGVLRDMFGVITWVSKPLHSSSSQHTSVDNISKVQLSSRMP
jgi:hypothetical protein